MRTQVEIDSDNCACGGTLAVPGIGVEAEEYVACPDCTLRFPHTVDKDNNTEATCKYCGMYYPDGPCPSLTHPARIPPMSGGR